MASLIQDLASSTPAMLEAFGDKALVVHALAFEAALSRAQASEGLFEPRFADLIGEACRPPFDLEALAKAAAYAGTLAIPLVAELRTRLETAHPEAAAVVHLGATSQDVADTALVLQAKAGLALLHRDLARLISALEGLARTYAATPMLARTLLRSAAPTTFGLKAAQWRLSLMESSQRLVREADRALVLQLGGAVGTLAGQDGRGQAVARRVADDLGLGCPPGPWHARRDAIAGLGAALAIATAVTAKFAGDLALLGQGEVAEAFEPRRVGRGGSSAMAHKRNPTGCQTAISAASRTPQLAAALIATTAGEHERGLGGWQAQAPLLADLFELTHGAVAAMADVAEGLEVDVVAMARNLAAAAVGQDVGEAEALTARLLAPVCKD